MSAARKPHPVARTATQPRQLQPVVISIVLLPTGDGNLQLAAVQGADPLTLPIMARVLGEAQQQVIAQFMASTKGGDE